MKNMEWFQFQNKEPVWVSFENHTGERGAGGKENNGAKGHPFSFFHRDEELVLCDLQGQGVIRRIWFTLADRSPEVLSKVYLNAFWDNEETPSVCVPIGDFFCMGNGQMIPFENQCVASPEGRSFVCWIPMPFRKRARLTLKNLSGKDITHLFYDVNITKEPVPEESLYFHTAFAQTAPELGDDVQILAAEGKGRFLGMSVAVSADAVYGDSWWGEGEVKVYFGKDEFPSLVGTGTEDYIGTAWGQGVFIGRCHGCTQNEEGKSTFYRFHTEDPIFFDDGCRVTLQNIGGCPKPQAQKLLSQGAEIIPSGADIGGKMIHLYRKDWEWKDIPEDAFITFYRRDFYRTTAYFYLERKDT